MTTQIVFKVDQKLKDLAMKKARRDGISLSSILKETTRSYVEGKIGIGIVHTPEIPNAKTARAWDKALDDIRRGRSFSPTFNNAKDAIAYLKKHAS